jgi:hypothetical protein
MPTKRSGVTAGRSELPSADDVAKALFESEPLSPTDELLLKPIENRTTQDWLQANYWAWRYELGARHKGLVMLREPNPARDKDLLQVAVLANVPAKYQERVRQIISYQIDRERGWPAIESSLDVLITHKRAIPQLKRLAKLLKELSATLHKPNVSVALALEHVAKYRLIRSTSGPPLDGQELAVYANTTLRLADQVAEALAVRRLSKPRRARGPEADADLKRPGQPGSFKRFVLRLLWDVEAYGGRLTLDKTKGTGTLIETLALLRPHLPPKFIPKVAPAQTLARIKALAAKTNKGLVLAPPVTGSQ